MNGILAVCEAVATDWAYLRLFVGDIGLGGDLVRPDLCRGCRRCQADGMLAGRTGRV